MSENAGGRHLAQVAAELMELLARDAEWQPCGRQLGACVDDVCRHMGECAWSGSP